MGWRNRGGRHQNTSPICSSLRDIPAYVISLLTLVNPTGARAVATGSEHLFQAPGLASSPWGIFTVSPESGGLLVPPPIFYYGESHSESWGELLSLLVWAERTHPLLFVPSGYPQIQSYNVQVAATDYNQFAMVFFQKTSENKQYFKITLYGEFLPGPSGLNFRSHTQGWESQVSVLAPSGSGLSTDLHR